MDNAGTGFRVLGTMTIVITGAVVLGSVGLLGPLAAYALVSSTAVYGGSMLVNNKHAEKKTKTMLKSLMMEDAVEETLDELHIVMKKYNEWKYNDEEKDPVKKVFCSIERQ